MCIIPDSVILMLISVMISIRMCSVPTSGGVEEVNNSSLQEIEPLTCPKQALHNTISQSANLTIDFFGKSKK